MTRRFASEITYWILGLENIPDLQDGKEKHTRGPAYYLGEVLYTTYWWGKLLRAESDEDIYSIIEDMRNETDLQKQNRFEAFFDKENEFTKFADCVSPRRIDPKYGEIPRTFVQENVLLHGFFNNLRWAKGIPRPKDFNYYRNQYREWMNSSEDIGFPRYLESTLRNRSKMVRAYYQAAIESLSDDSSTDFRGIPYTEDQDISPYESLWLSYRDEKKYAAEESVRSAMNDLGKARRLFAPQKDRPSWIKCLERWNLIRYYNKSDSDDPKWVIVENHKGWKEKAIKRLYENGPQTPDFLPKGLSRLKKIPKGATFPFNTYTLNYKLLRTKILNPKGKPYGKNMARIIGKM